MNLIGYKFLDESHSRRSAEILRMNKGETVNQFIKRCKQNGFIAQDPRNVVDHYKFMADEIIKGDMEKKRHKNVSLLCVNLINDFNIASCIRAANVFAVNQVFIYGRKQTDRRGEVGARNYTHLQHVKEINNLMNLANEFDEIICLDNVENSRSIYDHKFSYDLKTLIVAGQESIGCPQEILDMSTNILQIPQYGVIRSLNVAQAVAIALHEYCRGLFT